MGPSFDVLAGQRPRGTPVPEGPADATIGVASMLADGTVVLDLRAVGPGGMIGDGRLSYPPTHPDYARILAHVGPLRPGERRFVAPWP